MPYNKKKLNFNTVSVDLGCSSCRRPRLSTIFNPKPKPSTSQKHNFFHPTNYFYSSSFTNTSYTSTSSSSKTTANPSPKPNTPPQFFNDHQSPSSGSLLRGFGRVGGDSVAVEKESDDPYLDFRHSMLQMILEKEIYSKKELRELLNCFLQLNSPYYHGVIVRAFTEIWNGVFSVRSSFNYYNNHNVSGSGSQKLHYYYGYNSGGF